MPAGRLAREPANADEGYGQDEHVDNIDNAASGSLNQWNAAQDQRDIREENDPTLPYRGRALTPTVALSRKPILPRAARKHLRVLPCDAQRRLPRFNAPIQRRAAQRTVRCNRLLSRSH